MPPADYVAWADRHAAAFGLTREVDAAMVLEWAAHFARLEVPACDLEAATNRLMSHPPRWRDEHLTAIAEAVRCSKRTAGPAGPPPGGECRLCGGTGVVGVPSRKAIAAGRWGTEAVLCRCPLGLWHRGNGRAAWDTLEDYSRQRPRWRDELAEHNGALQRAVELSGSARHLDQALGPILGRLSRRQPAGQRAS